ncbi:MAG: hypothetical protein P4L79_02875 [Legionella sp.]|uniref:hypothetical protein n=1 Tax=Legionella sp. TaxID=459 RepID=UPI00283B9352|nr:hypothetical protein [Legionella sp.]
MRQKYNSFFQGDKTPKRVLTFREYIEETLIIAKRKNESQQGQRYTSAQLEIALVCFCDFEALKNEMDEDLQVVFPPLSIDYRAGFDWLDLSVSHRDEDAIQYFRQRLQESDFAKKYLEYKNTVRTDCALQKHETNNFEALETIVNMSNMASPRL